MSFKAYVIMDSSAEKAARTVKTLRSLPGVVFVDLLEDSPQLIMVVEASQRKKLAKLTVGAISAADSMATVTQLLTTTSGTYLPPHLKHNTRLGRKENGNGKDG